MSIDPSKYTLYIGGRRVEPLSAIDPEGELRIGDGELRPEFSVITEADVATHYDRATGVAGWTAKLVEGSRFEMTPPPGYVIAHGEDGSERLVKFDPSQVQFQVYKVNE